MKKILFSMLFCMGVFSGVKAQIGYQVSLLNTATGEPRANVTVNATVTITNSKNEVIYTGTQKATSNDFGVLSLTVGNADTFENVDFGKLPFFIEVDVDGQMIGKSQILNVPVAETAKTLTPVLTMEELCNKVWVLDRDRYFSMMIFYPNMTCMAKGNYEGDQYKPYNYIIQGKLIMIYSAEYDGGHIFGFINGRFHRLSGRT